MKLDKIELGLIVIGIISIVGIFTYLIIKMKDVDTTTSLQRQSKNISLLPVQEDSYLLSDINENIACQIPDGEATDEHVTVTGAVKMLYDEKEKGLNWSSFNLTNTGPDSVYVCVNKWKQPLAPIPMGQTISIDMKRKNAIKKVYLKCNNGESTVVNIHAIR